MANYYEHYQIPYDFNQVNNLYDHNYYDNYQHQQFGFSPMSYDNWNGSSEYETTTSASLAYSVSTMSEPKNFFYDPNVYTTYESPPQFSIYCNVQGFNEPEFEEYDPTPYGGGYDIVATYGKPLPPSVKICYPPSSTAAQTNPPSPPETIAPVPLGVYDGGEKKTVKKRVTFSEPLEEATPQTVKEDDQQEEEEARPLETVKEDDHQEDEEDDEEWEEEEDEDEEEEEEEDESSSYGTTIMPESVDYTGEVKAVYVPSGYGLEATDMCEVIFGGYFPCVSRDKRRQEDDDKRAAAEVSCWDSNDSDQWKTTSDYLFGDSYPYGYENRLERTQFEISSYGYQRY